MSTHSAGPWTVGYEALDVQAPSEKGGTFKICDIRGWGYLTGGGHGALGLDQGRAKAIQEANACLIAAAPDMLAALKALVPADFDEHPQDFAQPWHEARAVVAKAEGRA